MATLSFLWHLHQPAYRTADGVAHAPWTLVHAGGSYMTLARAIVETGGPGQVVNIVPTLLEQLIAYRDGRVEDPVMDAVTRPSADLDPDDVGMLLEWSFHVTPRQMERFPRLRELDRRRQSTGSVSRRGSRFGPGDLRDLQVLFILAQAGEQAWTDPRLRPLYDRGRGFSEEDHGLATQWLLCQPGELIEAWLAVAAVDGAEVATSPFAHPIMPLLADTGIVRESWAPRKAPEVPVFRYPQDARWQLDSGLRYMAEQGFQVSGCWPPEGSVSAEALAIYAEAGVRWLVTDEGILERSLGHPLRGGDGPALELYQPWQLDDSGPVVFFRDRWLSDKIGFVYGNWDDERQAAGALVTHLEGLARTLPEDAAIVIALDGENPWLHYPEGGGPFLRELMGRLGDSGEALRPATLSAVAAGSAPQRLPRLHPGSWINSVFATWIGHPEKTQAWRVLGAVRDAIAETGEQRPPSLLLAEGSDWFWWLGDDNPTQLAPLYDTIFRRHLADACAQAGIDAPVDLLRPIKTLTTPVQVPVSRSWPRPALDGRMTTYFEWSIAAWLPAAEDHPLERIAMWGDGRWLHLLFDPRGAMGELVNGDAVTVRLQSPEGAVVEVELRRGADGDEIASWAVDRVAELSLLWPAEPGWRLHIDVGGRRLPEGSSLLLEPFDVDEES